MQMTIQDKQITFDVQYGKRKKMVLDTTPEGHITLKVPPKTTPQEINDFMQSKSKQLLQIKQ